MVYQGIESLDERGWEMVFVLYGGRMIPSVATGFVVEGGFYIYFLIFKKIMWHG